MLVRIPSCVDGHFREGGHTNKEFLGTSVVWIGHVFSIAENSRHRGTAFFCTQMMYECQVPTMGAGNAKCRDVFPPWNTFHVLHISYQRNETDVEWDSKPNSPFLPSEWCKRVKSITVASLNPLSFQVRMLAWTSHSAHHTLVFPFHLWSFDLVLVGVTHVGDTDTPGTRLDMYGNARWCVDSIFVTSFWDTCPKAVVSHNFPHIKIVNVRGENKKFQRHEILV